MEDYANVCYLGIGKDEQTNAPLTAVYDPDGASGYARFETAANGKQLVGAPGTPPYDTQSRIALKKRIRAQEMTGKVDARATMFVWEVDYDMGDIIRMRSQAWRVEKAGRITQIEEDWSGGAYSAYISLGDALPKVSTKLKWMQGNIIMQGGG